MVSLSPFIPMKVGPWRVNPKQLLPAVKKLPGCMQTVHALWAPAPIEHAHQRPPLVELANFQISSPLTRMGIK